MHGKLCFFAVALLPVCFLSAQQPVPQPTPPANRPGFQRPSPEAMRKIAEVWKRMTDHAMAIDSAATSIHSLDDARRLVDLVAAEFSDALPPRWVTTSIRENIAHAEFNSAVNPGALIPEQRIADAWNDFVKKIGAPQDTQLTAADVHYLRDAQYVTARFFWTRQKDVWTIPGIFAAGPDRRIAQGARPLEAIRLLWLLGENEDDFAGLHAATKKGILVSDIVRQEAKSGSGQASSGYATAGIVSMTSFPVLQAALKYRRDHGRAALNDALRKLLKNLING